VDFVGPLPADVQEMTVFSSGIIRTAKQADAGESLGAIFDRTEAAQAFTKRGMQPGEPLDKGFHRSFSASDRNQFE